MAKNKKIMTVAIVKNGNKLLLGRKKKEGFGYSKWNGLGGKVELDESIDEAMNRECFEEGNIKIVDFIKKGILTFHYANDPEMEVHIYEITKFKNKPEDSDEMQCRWFGVDKLPFSEMWPDDSFWMPLFLNDKKFKGEFYFDKNYAIVKHKLTKINEL
jgi:8-oxo-dGTP diphosphatase/2-hydroxy-dATP diphosphatase